MRIGVNLRDYLERRFMDHMELHASEKESQQRAIGEALVEVQRRLAELNQLRAEVTEDRAQFVQNTAFDARADAVDKDLRQIRAEINTINESMARLSGRQAAYTAVLGVALVLVPLGMQLLLK